MLTEKLGNNAFCCGKRDAKISERLNIPPLIQFCGNLFFENCLDYKYLVIRILITIYSIAIIIWNFIRFAEQGYAKYWPYYFTQWFALLTCIYFGISSYLQYQLLVYIKQYDHKSKTIFDLNNDLAIEPPLYG